MIWRPIRIRRVLFLDFLWPIANDRRRSAAPSRRRSILLHTPDTRAWSTEQWRKPIVLRHYAQVMVRTDIVVILKNWFVCFFFFVVSSLKDKFTRLSNIFTLQNPDFHNRLYLHFCTTTEPNILLKIFYAYVIIHDHFIILTFIWQ